MTPRWGRRPVTYSYQYSKKKLREARYVLTRIGRYLCPVHHGLEHGPKTLGCNPLSKVAL